MTAPLEDVSSLPGKTLFDQEGDPIGKVTDIYAMDDGFPMWVGIEISPEVAEKRTVFLPLARLKEEDGEVCAPYRKERILEAPELDGEDGISEDADQQLRGYYGIGTGDQEMWSDNKGYVTLVPEEGGAAKRVEDPGQLQTPNADKRTDESKERVQDPGSAEIRHITAADITGEGQDDRDDADGSEDDQREAEDG